MNQKGLTLIELLIVLVLSSLLIAGIYRTFIHQQHTYTVQEQVVDMQQNVRIAINQMVREIRMAGYGRQDAVFWGVNGMHGKYKNVITPTDDGQSITVVGGYQEATSLKANAGSGSTSILLNDTSSFDISGKAYICINGTETFRIQSIVGDQINFFPGVTLKENHFLGEPVFLVLAITYSIGLSEGKTCLLRDENLGLGPQSVAENIEFLQFTYTLDDGSVFVNTVPGNRRDEIRMVQVAIRARTDRNDPELGGGGDGFRRRTLTSNIQLRNLSFI
jgi:prepilin-type N-terminal cleavage/methylation domain-containing protein